MENLKKISEKLLPSQHKYEPPKYSSKLGDTDKFLSDSETSAENAVKEYRLNNQRRQVRQLYILSALLLFTIATVLLLVAYILKRPSDHDCAAQLSVWCEQPLLRSEQYMTNDFY